MRNISPLRYRWSFPAKFFFYLLTIATLLAPIPFVFFKPGVPDNVAGKLIEIKEVKTYPVNGKLFILPRQLPRQLRSVISAINFQSSTTSAVSVSIPMRLRNLRSVTLLLPSMERKSRKSMRSELPTQIKKSERALRSQLIDEIQRM